jgi:hypothetical protein
MSGQPDSGFPGRHDLVPVSDAEVSAWDAIERKLAADIRPCRGCGCAEEVHQHHSASTYCGNCGFEKCISYRRQRRDWLAWIRRITG